MDFGEKLKSLRKEKGLTQGDVAERANISRQTIASYESGDVKPRRKDYYKRLADALECDEAYLRGEPDVLNPALGLVAGIAPTAPLAAAASIAGATASPLVAIGVAAAAVATMVGAAGKSLKHEKALPVGSGGDDVSEPVSGLIDPQSQDEKTLQPRRMSPFQALGLGLMYAALAERGIVFTPRQTEEEGLLAAPDASADIVSPTTKALWIFFVEPDGIEDEQAAQAKALSLVSLLVVNPPNPERETMIVVGERSLFDCLVGLKGRISLRSTVSAALIDSDDAALLDCKCLSLFSSDGKRGALPLLCEAEES